MATVTAVLAALVIAVSVFWLVQARISPAREGRALWSWIRTGALVCALLVTGILFGILRYERAPLFPVASQLGSGITARCIVTSVARTKLGFVVDMRIVAIRAGVRWLTVNWRAAWFTRSPSAGQLQATESLVVRGAFLYPYGAREHGALTFTQDRYEFSGVLIAVSRQRPNLFQSASQTLISELHQYGRLSATDQQLLHSLVFGDNGLNPQLKRMYLEAGLLHVLAASGANVLILISALNYVLFPLWRRLRLPYATWPLVLIGFVWWFAGMCQFNVSIIRAAIMGTYRLVGQSVSRASSTRMGLAVAALVMSLWQPQSMLQPGSLLSFIATAAVDRAISLRRKEQSIAGRPVSFVHVFKVLLTKVLQVFWTTLWVELYIIPVLVVFFHQITPYSIVANVLVEPFFVVLLPIAAAFLGLVWIGGNHPWLVVLIHPLTWIPWTGLTLLQKVVSAIDGLPGTVIQTGDNISYIWVIMYYSILVIFQAFPNAIKIIKRYKKCM